MDFETFKIANVSVSVRPTQNRGGSGYNEKTVDISSLNAKSIVSVLFNSTSSHMVWTAPDSNKANPANLLVCGYRIAGTYDGNMDANMRILYTTN